VLNNLGNNVLISSNDLYIAIKSNNIYMIKKIISLLEQYNKLNMNDIFNSIFETNNIEIITYLINYIKHIEYNVNTLLKDIIYKHSSYEVVKYLINSGYIDYNFINNIIFNIINSDNFKTGDSDVLLLLLKTNPDVHSYLNLQQWLSKNKYHISNRRYDEIKQFVNNIPLFV
jgi:hypothetical protein